MKNYVLIPARSGSKRIPNKNIIKFFNRPIIGNVISRIKKFKLFDKIIVSTDSKIIQKISYKYGADEVFARSKKLSGNNVPIYDVISNVINSISIKDKFLVTVILPTSVFISKADIKLAIKKVLKSDYVRSCSMSYFRKDINKSFFLNKENLIFFNKKKFTKKLNKRYLYDVGQFYVYRSDYFIDKNIKLKTKIDPVILSDLRVTDIDTSEDFLRAKKIYKKNFLK
jgi:pseudaminic acid cytidylyltransferase